MSPNAASPSKRSKTTSYLLLAIGLLLIGTAWLIPSQLKSLPVSLLREAGAGSSGLSALGDDLLGQGKLGAAEAVADAAEKVHAPGAEHLKKETESMAQRDPDLEVLGKWNPFLRQLFPDASKVAVSKAGMVGLLLPDKERADTLAFLSNSQNPGVQSILGTRSLKSYTQFMPVFSAAGQPLDATILLTALLYQSDAFSTGEAHELRSLADAAVASGNAAQIESVYLDILALARRYNWGQLVELTQSSKTLETLGRLAKLFRRIPDSASMIYGACLLSGDPDAVSLYLVKYGDVGREGLAFAVQQGKGSVDFLLRQNLPPSGKVPKPGAVEPVQPAALGPLVDFAVRQPYVALAVKYGIYFVAGFLVFWSFDGLTRLARLKELPLPVSVARRGLGALVLCLFLIMLNEPFLARGSQPSGYQLRVVVPIIGQTTAPSSINNPSQGNSVDIATIVSISFFFLMQCLVYLFCLMKIREIYRKDVPNLVKLKLLENEENLFDSGLYVGIAGTSGALVMQVLGLIAPNLLAAYSSNLFGILCVAFVKIRHVRPAKTRLIEMSEEEILVAAQKVGSTNIT